MTDEGMRVHATFGNLQISTSSDIYSEDVPNTLKAKFAKCIIKLPVVTLLAIGALLALIAGPFDAIVMRPRVDPLERPASISMPLSMRSGHLQYTFQACEIFAITQPSIRLASPEVGNLLMISF